MRKLLLVLLVLLVLGAMPASAVFQPAWGYNNTGYLYFTPQTYSVSFPYIITPSEAQVTAFCTYLGKGTHTNGYTWKNFADNTSAYGGTTPPGGYSQNITVDAAYNYAAVAFVCDGTYYWGLTAYKNTTVTPVAANFTANPTSGAAPIYVVFNDTSVSAPFPITSWNWSISPAAGWMANPDTLDDEDVTILFTANGNYTITHGASNGYNSDIETKTDYIQIFNSTEISTLTVTAVNSLNAYPIHGAAINLLDVENGSWVNTTTTDGTASINALSSHTIDIYASASGFQDNDRMGIPVTNRYESILLYPANLTNVSAGNVTLFVNVYDSIARTQPISGAGVTIISAGSSQMQITNAGGVAQFVATNKTTYLIDVEALSQGYQGATQTAYTGTGSGASATVTVTVYLLKKTATPTISPTTLPGGGTPTPGRTLLPGCTSLNDMSPECQASQNNYSMGWLSQNGLMLIQFFVICFFVFMLKGMGK